MGHLKCFSVFLFCHGGEGRIFNQGAIQLLWPSNHLASFILEVLKRGSPELVELDFEHIFDGGSIMILMDQHCLVGKIYKKESFTPENGHLLTFVAKRIGEGGSNQSW